MASAGFLAKLAFFLGGLLLWAAHFLFVYGLNGVACARGFGPGVPPTVAVATMIAAAGAVAILVLAALGRGPGIAHERVESVRAFWRYGTAILAGFSVVAIVWTGLAAAIIAPCI